MRLSDEYYLSEYQDLGLLHQDKTLHLLRNRVTGVICVKKIMHIEQRDIFQFLKEHPSPYIPQIYASIEDGAQCVVIEEYLDGQNLEEILQQRKFTETEVIEIGMDVCRALEPLHNAVPPIICRDLKPENIMITTKNKLKVVDFNIARNVRDGQNRDTHLMGTEGFAAPEQFGFRQTDGRTDIYAVGVLMNYLLTGCFPMERITDGKLSVVIQRCIRLDPKDRYQTMEELQEALGQIRDNSGEKYRAAGQSYTVWGKELLEQAPELGNESGKQNKSLVEEFMIPGFRSKTPWKMITAAAGYVFITWCCFNMEFTENDVILPEPRQTLNRFTVWISQIVFVALVCNYRGCKEKIPLLNNPKRKIRVGGYVLADLLMFVIAALVCAVLESIFF